MNATARKTIRSQQAALLAAVQLPRTARHHLLNGSLQRLLDTGNLVQASDYLRRLGLDDAELRSFRSWHGRYTKAAYKKATGGAAPITAWVDIDGYFRRVAVYLPNDRAFAAGVKAYKRLNTLLAGRTRIAFAEAA